MNENYKSGFGEEKQRAVERMREMNARSKYKHPVIQSGEENRRQNSAPQGEAPRSFLTNLNIPFLSNIGVDGDMALILGLVLILSAEKSDRLLLLALLYILM